MQHVNQRQQLDTKIKRTKTPNQICESDVFDFTELHKCNKNHKLACKILHEEHGSIDSIRLYSRFPTRTRIEFDITTREFKSDNCVVRLTFFGPIVACMKRLVSCDELSAYLVLLGFVRATAERSRRRGSVGVFGRRGGDDDRLRGGHCVHRGQNSEYAYANRHHFVAYSLTAIHSARLQADLVWLLVALSEPLVGRHRRCPSDGGRRKQIILEQLALPTNKHVEL